MFSLKRLLVGKPLKTSHIAFERLTKKKALAVFSSDALSSVAYATDEITIALAVGGLAALSYEMPVVFAILGLLIILTFSYRQTIHAYPSGGGAYIVARENLGVTPGLIAGASLLIDYVLTVSVSIASGVAAITSAFPNALEYKVLIALIFITLVTLANLRGVRESATFFAFPTYVFIISLLTMIVVGMINYFSTGAEPVNPAINPPKGGFEVLSIFLLLKAFASGCTALTGVEAISNGVPAFKAPEWKNARTTLLWMAITLFVLFLGNSFLSMVFGIIGTSEQTVMSQIADRIYGRTGLVGIFYYIMQISTTLILVLAANTSYADFPRLSSLLAQDGYLPRLLANRGDRLVFSNGIIALGILSSFLVVIFKADTHLLLPLYAIGVFLSFTLSQSGMVLHWLKLKEQGWLRSMLINGLGAIVTAITTLVIATEKFRGGAWLVIILIPFFVFVFKAIHRHYIQIADELRFNEIPTIRKLKPTIIIPVYGLNKVVVNTIEYAKSLSDNIKVVHIAIDVERAQKLKEKWESWDTGINFVILQSPYRSVFGPLIKYIKKIESNTHPDEKVTVLIPEFVTHKWWHNFLHNQTGFMLQTLLILQNNIVVTTVPYHLSR